MATPLTEISVQHESPTPHSASDQPTDVRDRTFPPIGLIVDGGVADAMGLEFRVESKGAVEIAHTFSESGVGMIVAKRTTPYAIGVGQVFERTVDALSVHGVRQMVALSHRLLESPAHRQIRNSVDGLTVAALSHGACTRLLSATFECTEDEPFVDGIFLRDADDENCEILLYEGNAARSLGFCVCLVEATTLRTDTESRTSEHRLAEVALRIPDAISPLASCYCQSAGIVRSNPFRKR